MFTTKHYVCKKCGHISQPLDSTTFVKTSINPCPNCGSGKIDIANSEQQAKKKSDKIKDTVSSVKRGVMVEKVQGEDI